MWHKTTLFSLAAFLFLNACAAVPPQAVPSTVQIDQRRVGILTEKDLMGSFHIRLMDAAKKQDILRYDLQAAVKSMMEAYGGLYVADHVPADYEVLIDVGVFGREMRENRMFKDSAPSPVRPSTRYFVMDIRTMPFEDSERMLTLFEGTALSTAPYVDMLSLKRCFVHSMFDQFPFRGKEKKAFVYRTADCMR